MASEPTPRGLVHLRTSFGDLYIELWPKEAPNAVRNFTQLALEHFYDGLTFHRLSPKFLVQGGCPEGTGEGGLSDTIFGRPFEDEYHSRLRFNRRGLIACASSSPGQNGTQFFITLGPCEHLTRKHTIFGRLTQQSLFNTLPLNDMEVDHEERPVGRVLRIESAEVLESPFEDLVAREGMRRSGGGGERVGEDAPQGGGKDGAKVGLGKKNTKLLSFGGDEEMDGEGVLPVKKRPRLSENPRQEPDEGEDSGAPERGDDGVGRGKVVVPAPEPQHHPPLARPAMSARQYAEEEAERIKKDLLALSSKVKSQDAGTARVLTEVEKRAAFWEAKRGEGKGKSKKEKDQETLLRLKKAQEML